MEPAEVPEVHEATGTLHKVYDDHSNGPLRPPGPLRPSLPSSGRIWTCGGVRNPYLQESRAPNPNPNDFILEPRSGLQKSADGYRYQNHKNK